MSPHANVADLTTRHYSWPEADRCIHQLKLRFFQIIGRHRSLVCDYPGCGAKSELFDTPDRALVWAIQHSATHD